MKNQLLVVNNLCKKYRDFQLKNVSFTLDAGYILGLVGQNGAGKTTLMKLIQNIVAKTSGDVIIDGLDYKKNEIEIKNRIGFIMESPFFELYTLEENGKVFGRFYKHYNHKEFLGYLKQFGLAKEKKYGELSKGMQTKFQLSFALSHQARLLILDEPTGGLDPVFRREFLTLLQEVVESENIGIIISTHITNDLDKIADYIALIDQGELLFCKTKEELLDEYFMIKGRAEMLEQIPKSALISVRKYREGFEALTNQKDVCIENAGESLVCEHASIEDIMFYVAKGRKE